MPYRSPAAKSTCCQSSSDRPGTDQAKSAAQPTTSSVSKLLHVATCGALVIANRPICRVPPKSAAAAAELGELVPRPVEGSHGGDQRQSIDRRLAGRVAELDILGAPEIV